MIFLCFANFSETTVIPISIKWIVRNYETIYVLVMRSNENIRENLGYMGKVGKYIKRKVDQFAWTSFSCKYPIDSTHSGYADIK